MAERSDKATAYAERLAFARRVLGAERSARLARALHDYAQDDDISLPRTRVAVETYAAGYEAVSRPRLGAKE